MVSDLAHCPQPPALRLLAPLPVRKDQMKVKGELCG